MARRALSHEHIVIDPSPEHVTRDGSSAHLNATTDGRLCEWHLPSVLVSVLHMRRGLRALLAGSALSSDETEDLLLAASEAANNAVEHARQPTEPFFDVCTEVDDGQVTIVIHDHGGWRQQTFPSDRGRGLAMMRALADTTVTTRSDGTTVTIRSRCAGPGRSADAGSVSQARAQSATKRVS